MPTTTNSTALANRLVSLGSYQKPHAYYRSKLFIASSTPNTLVAAAGPLLSLLGRLCVSPTLPAIDSLRDNIEHELHAFNSRLATQQGAEEIVAIANYLLCATIDELIGKSYLRLDNKPLEFKAFTPSSFDDIGPQHRFFELVTHLKDHTNQYLDLIELAYYCLTAGFEGEKHFQPDGRQQLDQ